jgi:hypothetical protein
VRLCGAAAGRVGGAGCGSGAARQPGRGLKPFRAKARTERLFAAGPLLL